MIIYNKMDIISIMLIELIEFVELRVPQSIAFWYYDYRS